jgi:uncharacterized protein (TIGR02266 family)
MQSAFGMPHAYALPTAVTEPCPPNAQPTSRAFERRRVPRAELNVGVGFLSDSNFYTGFTSDLSEGGLFVATHMLQPIGSELTLTFALPTGPEISVRGIVRWLRDTHDYNSLTPPGMGVQFLALEGRDLDRIREFVALREPLFFVS